MKFIDGILPPKTIKSALVVRDGLAYYSLGNFIGFLKSKDIQGVKWGVV